MKKLLAIIVLGLLWSNVGSASERFQKYNVSAMPVLNEENKTVIGILSERDLARHIYRDEFKSDLLVNEIFTLAYIFLL